MTNEVWLHETVCKTCLLSILNVVAVLIAGLSILGFALAEIPVKEELEIFSLLHHKL